MIKSIYFIEILLVVVFFLFAVTNGSNIARIFVQNEIVPDVVAVPPRSLVRVRFGAMEVPPGKEISSLSTLTPPSLLWNANPTSYYVMIMVDPDAPSRIAPLFRSFVHWFVVNIPGGDVSKGTTITFYLPSTPPPGTGRHRYVFIIYRMPHPIPVTDINKYLVPFIQSNGRVTRFNVNQFAANFGLGNPLFGNFYFVQLVRVANEILGTTSPNPNTIS